MLGHLQSRRTFLEKMIARLEPRATLLREMPDRRSWNIAGALERIIAADRAELETLPADPVTPDVVPAAPVADPDRVTWKHPVFNVGGRFNPFAGTYAQQMLASADVCDRLGYPQYGDGFRAHAARSAVRGAEAIPDVASEHRRPRSRSTWSGPNMPPPEPVPFVAGEQMGFVL